MGVGDGGPVQLDCGLLQGLGPVGQVDGHRLRRRGEGLEAPPLAPGFEAGEAPLVVPNSARGLGRVQILLDQLDVLGGDALGFRVRSGGELGQCQLEAWDEGLNGAGHGGTSCCRYLQCTPGMAS